MSPSTTRRRGQRIAGWAPTTARSEYDEEELEVLDEPRGLAIENLQRDKGEMDKGAIGEDARVQVLGTAALPPGPEGGGGPRRDQEGRAQPLRPRVASAV